MGLVGIRGKKNRPCRGAEAQFPILKKLGVISEQEEKLFMQRREVRRRKREEHKAFLDSLGKSPEIEQGGNRRPN